MGTPEYTLPEALELFHKLGLDGAEIVVQDGYRCGIPQDADSDELKRLRELADRLGLRIIALTPYYSKFNDLDPTVREGEIQGICKVIGYAEILGAKYIRIYAGNYAQTDTDPDGAKRANLVRSMRRLGDAAQKANFYSTMIMPVSGNLMNISYALTAAVGGLLSILQGFDLGGLVVYLNYSKQVGQPLNQISQQMTTLLSAMAGAERIFEVMDTQPEADQGQVTLVRARKENGVLTPLASGQARTGTWAWKVPKSQPMRLVRVLNLPDKTAVELPTDADLAGENKGWAWKYPGPDGSMGLHPIRGAVRCVEGEDATYVELKGAVRFNHVDFSYVPGKRVLHDVSVYANPGQKIAFVGSTGAGKTTITNLINRFYEIEGGLITYDGIDVRSIRKDDLRRSLGAVLQDTHLFTGTIMDNIRYGRLDATDAEVEAAARTVSADQVAAKLEKGWDSDVGEGGDRLSTGEKQLISFARAVLADPRIFVLDEATSSIDTQTEQLIQNAIDHLLRDRTSFLIAHRLSTIRKADLILVVRDGRIVEQGRHLELLQKGGYYHDLYTRQFAEESAARILK